MDLCDAPNLGIPIVIETDEGGARPVAELFRLGNGMIFADLGWPTATSNPFHYVKGFAHETEDGWAIGNSKVRIAFEGEQLFADYNAWLQWRASEEGKPFDRQACWREILSLDLTGFAE